MSDNPRVFISYSHDSPAHARRVLELSERLRDDGIDAQLDQYVNGAPDEGWPRWMLNELDKAEFVLVVCTETYYRRFRGHEQPGTGSGVDWEGALITLDVYKKRSQTVKFVPILFDPADEQYIPEPLGSITHYTLNSEPAYQRLKAFLLGQAGVQPRPLGKVQREDPKHVEPLTFPAESLTGRAEPRPIAPGLPQKIAPTRLRHSAEKLIGREDELARLDAAWAAPTTNVLTIVAFGGVGKTSLVAHWAAGLAQRGYDGASYFDWSFYSQGTREQGGASADQFINRALEFFGDPIIAASAASPWDKGARLAQLLAQRRTLLVLDGLEPLQYPPSSPLAGEMRDPAVATLLKGLAQGNPGLCVVTTRERVSDLTAFRESTAPELPLHHLSTPAGVELLRTVGVHGSETELEMLVKEVHGHALTLNLLGGYLVRAHSGDIRRRDQVRFDKADDAIQGGHAFKAMSAYERWLAPQEPRKSWWWPFKSRSRPGDQAGARQLAILRLMGLFDRPADTACLAALRRPPAIAGLTEPIVDLPEDDWNLAIATLADCGLVAVPKEPGWGAIDAHPLIREYFAKRLRDDAPQTWREAHARLYEHLKDSVEHQPDTLDGLQPLYQAVAHGCHAQRHPEVWESVYRNRIMRGDRFYSVKQLGAFGADLGAVASFFDQPWTTVSRRLTVNDQSWLLTQAAVDLRALGRLSEALQPMRSGLTMDIEQEVWENAAISAGNLSELELTLGNIAPAVAYAEQAVAHANRDRNAFRHLYHRTTLADALHRSGRRDDARALFDEAEELQAEYEPDTPLLYSLQGFRYCDLLLSQPERTAWGYVLGVLQPAPWLSVDKADDDENIKRGVDARAAQALAIAKNYRWLLSIAHDHLTLGRASLYRSIVQAHESATQPSVGTEPLIYLSARDHMDAAVDGLRRAGQIDELPGGLLSRAWLRFLQGDSDAARTDLDEAWEIAERGPMRLHMADIHLYRARLFHAVRPYSWDSPHADLAAARKLIEQCGYWRRKEELEDAEEAAKNWQE